MTEADYDGFLTTFPLIATYLSNLLITKTAVFFGYSLDDPDFRQIWNVVSQRLGRTRRMAYSVAVNASPSDITRLERRGVKVVNLPGSKEKYGEIFAEAFKELREYMRDNVISVSKVTEEEPLRELLLPRDSTTRLCFFSLPLDLLPLYRSRIFPVVEEIGFVPVTADDVVAPGDNVNAKIYALIDRASVVVIELASQWTKAEYDMVVARSKSTEANRPHRQHLHVIVVAGVNEQLPQSAVDFRVVRRPSLLTEDPEDFVEHLAGRLREIAAMVGLGHQQEPRRLFEVKEYRAAVISAMTLLETTLRQHLGKELWTSVRRPMSFRQLLDHAAERQLLDPLDRSNVLSWMQIRNEAVHTSKPIGKQEAREIVDGVFRLLGGLS